MSQRTAERVEELRHRVGESEPSSVTSSARSYGEGNLKERSADLSYRTYKILIINTDTAPLIVFPNKLHVG